MRDFLKNRYLSAVSNKRFVFGILFFIIFILTTTGSLGGWAKNYRLNQGYANTIKIFNEIMQITDYERDKTFTSGNLIQVYIVESLYSRYKGLDCRRNKAVSKCIEVVPYKTYNGNSTISEDIYSGGMSIAIDKVLLKFSSPRTPTDPVYIMADFNGPAEPPNRLGYDVFVFEIVDGKLMHEGDPITSWPVASNGFYCSPTSTSKSDLQGVNCAYKLKTDKKYFHKLKYEKKKKK